MSKEPTEVTSWDQLARLWGLASGERLPEEDEYADGMRAAYFLDHLEGPLPLSEEARSALPRMLGMFRRQFLPLAGKSMREALLDATTEIAAVEQIKDHARARGKTDCPEAEQAAMMALYYAAIAHALVHHGKRITAHGYGHLRSAYSQLIESKWVPEDLRALFAQARGACEERAG